MKFAIVAVLLSTLASACDFNDGVGCRAGPHYRPGRVYRPRHHAVPVSPAVVPVSTAIPVATVPSSPAVVETSDGNQIHINLTQNQETNLIDPRGIRGARGGRNVLEQQIHQEGRGNIYQQRIKMDNFDGGENIIRQRANQIGDDNIFRQDLGQVSDLDDGFFGADGFWG